MTTIRLSARFGEHQGHEAMIQPVPPRDAFLFSCSCGAWFRITPEEARKGGDDPYQLETIQIIDATD